MGSLTVAGDLGFAQLVGAVSYYERTTEYLTDITTYAHYWSAQYCHDTSYTAADLPYYWTNPDTGYVVWWPVYCHGPQVDSDFYNSYRGSSKDDKLTAEIRLTSQGETLDWILGLYHEESTDSWISPFGTPTLGGDASTLTYQDSISLNYWEWYWSNYSGAPDATAGDREYRLANAGRPPGRTGSEDQFVPKVSLSYNLDDSKMVYALYARGARQGSVNRSRGEPFFPNAYDSDIMDNFEVGFKSTFGEGRGRFNVIGYRMDRSDYQLQLVDPTDPPCPDENGNPLLPETEFNIPGVCGQPWQVLIANAGDAHIIGANFELDYAFGDNWLLGLNYERMEAETDTEADLNGDGVNDLVKGLRLPLVPQSKGSAWLEYRRPTELFGRNEFFVRTQWSYTGDNLNILEPRGLTEPNPQFRSEGYTIGDLRAGIVGDDWQVDVFINNLADERANYTVQADLFEWAAAQTAEGRAHHQTLFVNRPREFGIRYMKRWGD
ncbi:MAG: TonB-dependent receptor [Woeseia sp.]